MDTFTPPARSTTRGRAAGLLAALGMLGLTLLLQAAWPSPSAAAVTCTRYWTGATSSAWENSANWSATDGGSSASVPTATDVACMSTSPTRTVVVVNDGRQVAGITFPANGAVQPTLRLLSTASLQVGGAAPDSYDSVVRTLDLQPGSTLSGSAAVTAHSIGSLAGVTLGSGAGPSSGRLVLGPGASTTLGSSESVLVDGGYSLENNGSVTTNNGYVFFGYYGANKVVNNGTWTVTNTSTDTFYDPYGTGSATNAAGGTITYTAPTAADTVPRNSVALVNNGLVTITRGHVANSVNASGSGTYNLGASTTWEQNGADLGLSGSQFTGTGTFNMNGGSVTTSTSATLPIDHEAARRHAQGWRARSPCPPAVPRRWPAMRR